MITVPKPIVLRIAGAILILLGIICIYFGLQHELLKIPAIIFIISGIALTIDPKKITIAFLYYRHCEEMAAGNCWIIKGPKFFDMTIHTKYGYKRIR